MAEKTALVVDDSRSARYAMRKFLENAGYTVDTAESAQDAYVYLQRRHPQVIFLDHQMPGSDGLDVLRVLKDDSASADIPVVLCSGQEEASFQHTAQQSGAIAVLPKPPDAEQLKALLRRLSDNAGTMGISTSGMRTPPSLGLPSRHLSAPNALRPQPSPARHDVQVPDQAMVAATKIDSARPPDTASAEIRELRRAVEHLQNELADLRRSAEAARGSADEIAPEKLIPALLPALLEALEQPIRAQAQRAVGQMLQHRAERMLQEARALIAGAGDNPDGNSAA